MEPGRKETLARTGEKGRGNHLAREFCGRRMRPREVHPVLLLWLKAVPPAWSVVALVAVLSAALEHSSLSTVHKKPLLP